MPVYKFRGRDLERGSLLVGKEYAESKNALAERLRRKGVLPITICEQISLLTSNSARIKSKDLALLSKQLSVMLRAGLPLVQCLTVLWDQQENHRFKAILAEVRADVEGGSTLAQALLKHPNTFGRLFTDMVEAGELGGFLDLAFDRLSVYIRRAVKVRSQAIAAAAYPITVTVIALITVSLTLLWVVPVFVTLFEGLDVPLPLMTRIVIGTSELVTRFGAPFSLSAAAGAIAIIFLRKRVQAGVLVDQVLLRAPLIGKVIARIAVARFSLTLATLLRSGIPLLKGLEITATTSRNSVFRNALLRVRSEVLNGRALFEPMEESGVFPPLVTRMIAVGERSGELDQMLEHLSVFYEEESENAVNQMMTALEPTLVILLGVFVGGIVISMYLPIFSLVGHFAH